MRCPRLIVGDQSANTSESRGKPISPGLAEKADALKASPLWHEVSLPPQPLYKLHPFPPKIQLTSDKLGNQDWSSSQGGLSGPAPLQASRGQEIPAPPMYQQAAQQSLPAASFHASSSPTVQIGQFAQVLEYGRPIGVVQMTHQGWAGAPHLLNIFSHQDQFSHPQPQKQFAAGAMHPHQRQLGSLPQSNNAKTTAGVSNYPAEASAPFAARIGQIAGGVGNYALPRRRAPSEPALRPANPWKRQRVADNGKPSLKLQHATDWRSEDIELLDEGAESEPEMEHTPNPALEAGKESLKEVEKTCNGREQGNTFAPAAPVRLDAEKRDSTAQEIPKQGCKSTEDCEPAEPVLARACPAYLQVGLHFPDQKQVASP